MHKENKIILSPYFGRRLLLAWLIVYIAGWGWVLINNFIIITPLWLDVLFGFVIVMGIASLLPHLPIKPIQRRWIVIAGIITVMGLSFAILWLNWQSLPESVIAFLEIIIPPIYVTQRDIAGNMLGKYATQLIILAVFGLIMAYAWQLTWQHLFSKIFVFFHHIMLRIPIRWGRMLMWGKAICGLILLICILILAWLSWPGSIPQLENKQVITGPYWPETPNTILPSSDGKLYVGTSEGVFSSDNDGISWRVNNIGLRGHVNNLIQAKNGRLYAGTYYGIFYSDNNGTTWMESESVLSGKEITSLVLTSNGYLFVATASDGLFRSTDNGISWQFLGAINSTVKSLTVDLKGRLYVGTYDKGVLRSKDWGETWQQTNFKENLFDVNNLVVSPSGRIYATSGQKIFFLEDNKDDWQLLATINESINTLVITASGEIYIGTAGYPAQKTGGVFHLENNDSGWRAIGLKYADVKILALDSNGRLYASVRGDGLYRLDNANSDWYDLNSFKTIAVYTLMLKSDGKLLCAGTYAGVFCSNDGGTVWKPASAGIAIDQQINDLAISSDEKVLFAGTYAGVFRSKDFGESWQPLNDGLDYLYITSLKFANNGVLYAAEDHLSLDDSGSLYFLSSDEKHWQVLNDVSTKVNAIVTGQNGDIYIGTARGVFRSRNNGMNWQDTGLRYEYINTLTIGPNGEVFAGTGRFGQNGGVFRSDNNGETWESIGLTDTDVITLKFSPVGRLFAGTSSQGLLFSDDGTNWQSNNNFFTNSYISDLEIASDGVIYIGTHDGLFRSYDNGENWQDISFGLADVNVKTHVLTHDGLLYLGTDYGVFVSDDKGLHWKLSSLGLWDRGVQALIIGRDGRLYAGLSANGICYSDNNGSSWEKIPNGSFSAKSLAWGSEDQLYVGSDYGILRLNKSQTEWSATSSDFNNVTAMAVDTKGILCAKAESSIFCTSDSGKNWQQIENQNYLLQHLLPDSVGKGILLRLPNGTLLWADDGKDIIFNSLPEQYDILHAKIWEQPDGQAIIIGSWGATIWQAKVSSSLEHLQPTSWLAIRLLALYQVLPWISTNWNLLVALFGSALGLVAVAHYFSIGKPFDIPLLPLFLAGSNISAYISSQKFQSIWPDWSAIIRTELLRFGDATPPDLGDLPTPFRRFALHQYLEKNPQQAIQLEKNRLSLLYRQRLRRGQRAWDLAARWLGPKAGIPDAASAGLAELADSIAEPLGLKLESGQSFSNIQVYPVQSHNIRLNLPPNFPLLLVADPQPGEETVRCLAETMQALRGNGYLALVVALEPLHPSVDIPAELKRAIHNSPFAQDFVVLSKEDLIDIWIARHPEQVLVKAIASQVDISVLSPFVVNGPTPPGMFFGRENEVRQVVENAVRRSFAIIGNRKIGKTSLLKRLEDRLRAEGQVRSLRLDCQTIHDAASFMVLFQANSGITLDEPTPSAWAAAVRQMAQQGQPLLFLLDEVDALLNSEAASGEKLLHTWRELYNNRVCQFVFFGTFGLARRLRQHESAMFNFPEAIPLGYLSRSEVDEMISQPLKTLGVVMDDQPALLENIWALTSGHPNLAQAVGKALVESANARAERRITLADVTALWGDAQFTDFYFDTIWGAANPLEKLVTLLAPAEGFRIGEIETLLKGEGLTFNADQLDAALQMLVTYTILRRDGRQYTYGQQAFPAMRERHLEIERLITAEKRKWEGLS